MFCILLNSISMALFDYHDHNKCAFQNNNKHCPYPAPWNKGLGIVSHIFGVVFIAEAVIKIFALGFICGKNSYMKNMWNVLDFIIALSSLTEISAEYFFRITHTNIKVIRVMRILRPLKVA